jgi:hypothetical protein
MSLFFSAATKWLLARIAEPSTWAGTGIVAAMAHSLAPGAAGEALIAVGAAVGGLLAVVVPEKRA